MARARSQKAPRAARDQEGASARPWGEFLGVALLALSVLLIGGLISFQAGDGLLMGPVGQLLATALYAVLGMAEYGRINEVLERVLTMRVVEAELAGAGGGAP